MSESRAEIDARKWREAIAFRRPKYRLLEQCCATCKHSHSGPDGDLICTREEIRTLPVNPTPKQRAEAARAIIENAVADHGICDAWEK